MRNNSSYFKLLDSGVVCYTPIANWQSARHNCSGCSRPHPPFSGTVSPNKLHKLYESQCPHLSAGLPNPALPPSRTVRRESRLGRASLTVTSTGKGPGLMRVPGAAARQGSAKWRALRSINPAHLPHKPGRLSDGANWRLTYKHGLHAFPWEAPLAANK